MSISSPEIEVSFDFYASHYDGKITLYAFVYNAKTVPVIPVIIPVTVKVDGTEIEASATEGYLNVTLYASLDPGEYLAVLSLNGVEVGTRSFKVTGNRVEVKDLFVLPEFGTLETLRTLTGRTVLEGTDLSALTPPVMPIIRPSQLFWDRWQTLNPEMGAGFKRMFGDKWNKVEGRLLDAYISKSSALNNVKPETRDGQWMRKFSLSQILPGQGLWNTVLRGKAAGKLPLGAYEFEVVVDNSLNQWGHWNPPLPTFTPVSAKFTVAI